jgi:Tol biopolymer transport system component
MVLLQGSLATGPYDLWTLDLSDPDAPEARPYLTSEANLAPIAISPDGALAAYGSDETGTPQVYVRSFPVPGERTVVSTDGGAPFWSPDGGTLYHFVRRDRDLTVVAARLRREPVPTVLSTDTLFTIRDVQGNLGPGALHPDGDRFVFPVTVGAPEGVEGSQGVAGPRLILVQNWFEELRERLGEN